MVSRIRMLDISDEAGAEILGGNAARLLHMQCEFREGTLHERFWRIRVKANSILFIKRSRKKDLEHYGSQIHSFHSKKEYIPDAHFRRIAI
jgi:hypothetical protein